MNQVYHKIIDLQIVKRLATLYAMALQRQRYEAAQVEAEARKAEELEKLVPKQYKELKAILDEARAREK